MRKGFTRVLVIVLSATAIVSFLAGVATAALNSSLFAVRHIVVEQPDLTHPTFSVSKNDLISLAGIPVGQAQLFHLDFDAIEHKILNHPWISEVHLRKRFPDTLVIAPTYRQAKALYQRADGGLFYVDGTGKFFGKLSLNQPVVDLPVINGVTTDQLAAAISLVDSWDKTLSAVSQISSLGWSPTQGFRVTASYSLSGSDQRARTVIEIGKDFFTQSVDDRKLQLARLKQVIAYLSQHNQNTRLIWTDIGKKIVVKIARG